MNNPKPRFFGSIVFKIEFIILIILLLLTLICTAQEQLSIDSLQKQMDIRFINLFEAVDSLPEKSIRVYSTEFDVAQTRRIYVELNVTNKLYDQTDQSHIVKWEWINPNGEVWGTTEAQFNIKKEWEWAYTSRGWGWSLPGNWEPGVHKARVIIDDIWSTEQEFVVERKVVEASQKRTEVKPKQIGKPERRKFKGEFYFTIPTLTLISEKRAGEIDISTRSWGMDFGYGVIFREIFQINGEFGFSIPKDFDPFSQYVTSGGYDFDADSDFSVGSMGLTGGLYIPRKVINLEKKRYFSPGINLGAKRFKAKRSIDGCSDCNVEKFKFNSYLFAGPEIKLFFMDYALLSAGYNWYFQGEDIDGQVYIKVGLSGMRIE